MFYTVLAQLVGSCILNGATHFGTMYLLCDPTVVAVLVSYVS